MNFNTNAKTVATQVKQELQNSPLGNYSIFLERYTEAEVELEKYNKLRARKIETKPFKQLKMFKLLQEMRGYHRYSRRLAADALYLSDGNVNQQVQALAALRELHDYVKTAAEKVEYRLGFDSQDFSVISYQQAGVWKSREGDNESLKGFLMDMRELEDRWQFIYFNSTAAASEYAESFVSLMNRFPKAAARVQAEVLTKVKRRTKAGKASRTDRTISGELPLNMMILPHVLNRYLNAALVAQSKLEREVEQGELRRERAIREISGMANEHRTRKVGGYQDLSGEDKQGFAEPGSEAGVDADQRRGDDEKGIVGLDELLAVKEQMDKLIAKEQDGFGQVFDLLNEARTKAGMTEKVQMTWLYLQDGTPICDRDEAIKLRDEGLEKWIAERREAYFERNEAAKKAAADATITKRFIIEIA